MLCAKPLVVEDANFVVLKTVKLIKICDCLAHEDWKKVARYCVKILEPLKAHVGPAQYSSEVKVWSSTLHLWRICAVPLKITTELARWDACNAHEWWNVGNCEQRRFWRHSDGDAGKGASTRTLLLQGGFVLAHFERCRNVSQCRIAYNTGFCDLRFASCRTPCTCRPLKTQSPKVQSRLWCTFQGHN